MKDKNKKTLESEITIKLTFENESIARIIEKSTAPENKETPKNVKAFSITKNNELNLRIIADNSLKDLLTTVEDYLEKIDLSYKTIKTLKKE